MYEGGFCMLFITLAFSAMCALNCFMEASDFGVIASQELLIYLSIFVINIFLLYLIFISYDIEIEKNMYKLITLQNISQTSDNTFYLYDSNTTKKIYFCYQLQDGNYKKSKILSKNVSIYERKGNLHQVIITRICIQNRLPKLLLYLLVF